MDTKDDVYVCSTMTTKQSAALLLLINFTSSLRTWTNKILSNSGKGIIKLLLKQKGMLLNTDLSNQSA